MNGGADLGGMMGFGPIIQEEHEPNFHATWEERVMGMVVALGASGMWNIDQSRFARESMQPADYMHASYYEIWLYGLLSLLKDTGMISEAELNARAANPHSKTTAKQGHAKSQVTQPVQIKRKLLAAEVLATLMAGGPANRCVKTTPQFSVGQHVKTINSHPKTHTRLPRYARDKVGVISKIHGAHVYPDSAARGLGDSPTWLYQVCFSARTLWGDDKNAQDTVSLDLWQPYLRIS